MSRVHTGSSRTARRTLSFRVVLGSSFIAAGCGFLTANSVILARGVTHFVDDPVEKVVYGGIAAAVPWVIAGVTEYVPETMWRLGWLRLPTFSTIVLGCVWSAFIAYNLANGFGSLAHQRDQVAVKKEADSRTVAAIVSRRAALQRELDGVPVHRPVGTVEAAISAAKLTRAWTNSRGCSDARTPDQRTLCKEHAALTGELAASKRSDELTRQIVEIDAEAARSPQASPLASGDPQTELLMDLTGERDQKKVRRWLSASTPLLLEVGAALLIHYGLAALGIGLRPLEEPHSEPETAVEVAALLMSPEAINARPVASLEALRAQRAGADQFFKTVVRPVASGALSEEDWYDHYLTWCRRLGVEAVSIDRFRRIAAGYVPRIGDVDGVTTYHEVLPIIPQM